MSKKSLTWLKKPMDWLFIPSEKQNMFANYILVFFVLMVAILSVAPISVSSDIVVGRPALETIVSPKNFTYIDMEKTRELRLHEMAKVQPVYIPTKQTISSKELFNKRFETLKKFHSEYAQLPDGVAVKDLLASYTDIEILLDDESLKQLKTFNAVYFDRLKEECESILSKYYDQLIAAENVNDKRKEALAQIENSPILFKSLMMAIIRNSINVNAEIEKAQTEKKRHEAAATVQPVKHTYEKVSYIVSKGNIVTQEAADALKMLVEDLNRNRYLSAVGYSLLSFILIFISLVFLRVEKRSLLGNLNQYKLMGVLFLFALAVIKIVFLFNSNIIDFISILFTPIPSVALLMCMLLDSVIAVFNVFMLGLIVVAIAGTSFKYVVISIFGSIAGILAWKIMNHGNDVRSMAVDAGIRIGLVNSIGVLAFLLIDGESFDILNFNHIRDLLLNIGAGFINGLLSGIIANGVMPILEKRFSLATVSKLNELSSPTHQLLKKLAEEAPGTYQHSMAVATLAEAGAAAIHADPLITRISAYYHDIGKINRPKYFIENLNKAAGEESPHNSITPNLSALIVMGHVRDGVDIGRDYNLPETVLSIMGQHHGTTLVEYFYSEAKKLNADVSEERFRYPGPKPQSKEAAILMLADSIEAAARTLPEHSYAEVEDLVNRIIDKKHNKEKQLEESDITLKEVDIVKEVFIKTIMSMYHGRIEYPDSKPSKEQNDENSDQQ